MGNIIELKRYYKINQSPIAKNLLKIYNYQKLKKSSESDIIDYYYNRKNAEKVKKDDEKIVKILNLFVIFKK